MLKQEATALILADKPACDEDRDLTCPEAFGENFHQYAQINITNGEVNPSFVPDTVTEANFIANRTTIQVGESINFKDQSTNNPNSWSWTFEGGSPSTSTAQNPRITYTSPGIYSVTLRQRIWMVRIH